jgi:hypothetical protein
MKAVASAMLAAAAFAGTCRAAPVIVGDSKDPRCVEAAEMAATAYRSKRPSLLWPIPRPVRPGTRIILTQKEEEISGGHGIDIDPSAFDAIESGAGGSGATLYRRRNPAATAQLIVVDAPFNWQGDRYSVYLLNGDAALDRLGRHLDVREPAPEKPIEPALGESWMPPIVLTDNTTGTDWIIERGEPYAIMADWTVHGIAGDRLTTPCRIAFGLPEAGGLSLLPRPVRQFAAALDEALGPGDDEGTLHPTARIRLLVQGGWANAALRPWAMPDTSYNGPSEVDRGLIEWAQGNRARRALLDRVRSSRRRAEGPLAAYYAAHFGKEAAEARRLSRSVLDRMYLTNFVFPK